MNILLQKCINSTLFFYAILLMSSASSCSPADGRDDKHMREPNPEQKNEHNFTNAKVTNVTFLTNVTEIGLFGGSGRITCMVIDKADSNHFIAGSETGGLWSSNDRGKTWQPIDDQLPTLRIHSISQNPFQTNVYYASCNATILAGQTSILRPDIYKSTDGGQTFQLVPTSAGTFGYVVKVVCSPIDANTVYVLSSNLMTGRGIHRSQDNGQTFTLVYGATGFDNATDLEVLPNGTVLASLGTEVVRSISGNPGTFAPVNGLNGTNTFSNINFAFCQSQPNNLYAVTTGGNSGVGVFRSTDGGQNWSFLQSLQTGVFTRTVGVKPDDPAFFFAGSVGLYLSQNSGNTFQFYGVGGVDWWSVNFDPHNPDKVFMTFDQGIVEVGLDPFNSNNNTAYIRRDTLLNSAQIYAGDHFPTGDKVMIGMQDLGTRLAWLGGERNVGSGDGGFSFFHKQDTTIGYATYQNGRIYKKPTLHLNFGQTGWQQPFSIMNQLDADNDDDIDEGAFFIHPFWVNDANSDQLYFPTKRRLWRSTNGGTSWQPISNYYDLTVMNSGVAYIEGNDKPNPIVYWAVQDTLFVMPNAATAVPGNELKVNMPGKIRAIRTKPDNDSIVYITTLFTTTGPRIYRSSNIFNGTVQWTDLTGDLPDQLSANCFEVNLQDSNQMLIGTSSGLWVSENGGQHWDRDLQLPNVNILGSSIRMSDERVFIYTYGRGAWAARFPDPSSVNTTAKQPEQLDIWPNPVIAVTHVALPTITRQTSLKVWSVDGKLQKNITGLQYSPYPLNVSDLPAGTYVIGVYEGSKRLRSARLVKL